MSAESHKTIEGFKEFLIEENGIGFERNSDRSIIQDYLAFGSSESLRIFLSRFGSRELQSVLKILMKFFIFMQQDELSAEVFKIADGYDIPDVFRTLLEEEGCSSSLLESAFGEEKPAQYASDDEKTDYISNAHAKLKEKVDPEIYQSALFALAHGLGKDLKPNKVFHKRITEGNIDEYLKVSAENHYKGYTEYFLELYGSNAKLKAEFLDAVERMKSDFRTVYDPKRKVIRNPKWPYDPIAYYKETDPIKKRYAQCHCPWARNAIKEGRTFDKSFCECSVGFNRKNRLGDIEGNLPHEKLETVLNGGSHCSFEFHLSEYFGRHYQIDEEDSQASITDLI